MTDKTVNELAVLIESGIRPEHRSLAVEGYWDAFSSKLHWPLGPKPKALAFLRKGLDPGHAISAVSDAGDFLGVAGFKTPGGAFIDGGFRDLTAVYGWISALSRGLLLGLLDRECEPNTLLMDGIFVQPSARGLGIGSKLLASIEAHALSLELHRVRLDVIDKNPRARALYERRGFVQTAEQSTGVLAHIFGFHRVATMVKKVM